MAVLGKRTKNLLVKRGMHPNRIIITGYPLLDGVPKELSQFDRATIMLALNLKPDTKLAVFASQPLVEDGYWNAAIKNKLLHSIIDACQQVADLHLVIKVHPRENLEIYKKYSNKNITIIKDVDLHKLILASNVVLTVNSTVGLCAIAYGKPLITFNCFSTKYSNPYADGSIEIKNLEELPINIKKAVINASTVECEMVKARAFLSDQVYKLDGNSSKRIAKLILTMIIQKRNLAKG